MKSENESQVKESRNNSEITNDAEEYLAAAKKSRAINEHDYVIPSWISHLSYGGLITLSKNFKTNIFRVERLFKKNDKATHS
ncbi:THAP-type domain-containing protein [Aphis craccivora]|uniref:THAP-type domain-containing protein n=1 Tax=Aphis craccivora TaxID=307492 RepID=A0A6G0WH86_APHCR|nr:THAP-type domain-containing protein [Aphis craccivora]